MGLVGSLEDLSLLDILQIVNVSRRTGLLQIEPDGTPASYIYFSAGAVKDIVGSFDEASFVGFFREQGLVDPGETQQAQRLYPDDPGAVLRHLLDAGILNDRLIEQARKQELSYRLKALTQQAVAGSFAFFLEEPGGGGLPDAPTPFWPLNQPVSPQNLLTQTLSEQAFQRSSPPPSTPAAPAPGPSLENPAAERGGEEEDLPFADAVPLDEPVRPPSPAPRQRVPEDQSGTRWQPAKSHITIVLAAAESIFKNMLWQRLLAHYSHVERAESFAEYDSLCRTLLEKGTPFVSVIDLLMPTRDGKGYLGGLEILEHSRLEFPGVKVLMMSDLRDEDLVKITRTKGAASTLPKPDLAQFKVGQLDQVLDEFSAQLCHAIDDLVPPVEEEVAEFFKDLGAESVGEGYRIRDQLGLLKGLMGELARPQETPEISLLVLRLASEYFERAVLFLVKRTQIVGLGGFGDTGDRENMAVKVRRLNMPLEKDTAFEDTVATTSTVVREDAAATEGDHKLLDSIGLFRPKRFALIPMVSRGKVIAVLYADNAVSGREFPDISGMEIFMAQAGLAMEKALLERQLMSYRRGLKDGKDF